MDKKTRDHFKSIKLTIGTPCYGGMVGEHYTRSMINFNVLAAAVGMTVYYSTLTNESLVTRARNSIANSFLQNKESTHLMFIDADISFDRNSILNMILKNKDVIAGSYPLKTVDWENVFLHKDGAKNPQDLERLSIGQVINIKKPDEKKLGTSEKITIHGGALPIYDAGTGFMLIKRKVFEEMVDAYPEILYYSDGDLSIPKKDRKMYAFFDTSIDEDGRYLSEDYTFCRRWQKLGGEIHLDTDVVLNHFGSYLYKGNKVFN